MRIDELKPDEIYVNSRQHLVTLWNGHICYIDIPREAVVLVEQKSLKGDDWTLYTPESIEVLGEEEFKKRPVGRPRKIHNE